VGRVVWANAEKEKRKPNRKINKDRHGVMGE